MQVKLWAQCLAKHEGHSVTLGSHCPPRYHCYGQSNPVKPREAAYILFPCSITWLWHLAVGPWGNTGKVKPDLQLQQLPTFSLASAPHWSHHSSGKPNPTNQPHRISSWNVVLVTEKHGNEISQLTSRILLKELPRLRWLLTSTTNDAISPTSQESPRNAPIFWVPPSSIFSRFPSNLTYVPSTLPPLK